MTDTDNDGFLRKYRIEFPSPSSLAVLHAEPVSLVPYKGYTFSDDALKIIGDLVALRNQTAVQFNQRIASTCQLHEEILFFLDGPYHMAYHILAVRKSISEIGMISCVDPAPPNLDAPPPIGLLTIADVETLMSLSKRSPFLGKLLPITDGHPDGATWAYFLGKADQVEIEDSEKVEAPTDWGNLTSSLHPRYLPEMALERSYDRHGI